MTTTTAQPTGTATLGRKMLNKVPEVTIFFWVIKIMCTTVGETAADYLNDNLGFGLTKTTYVTGALLIVLLAVQFRLRRYVPGIYWSVVVVISVFGMNAVLSFWLAYILTRPLGASIGDEMSQNSHKYGGLGLGTTGTSYIFLGCILALVAYLSITRRDATEARRATPLPESA